jgi:hypothetical protein
MICRLHLVDGEGRARPAQGTCLPRGSRRPRPPGDEDSDSLVHILLGIKVGASGQYGLRHRHHSNALIRRRSGSGGPRTRLQPHASGGFRITTTDRRARLGHVAFGPSDSSRLPRLGPGASAATTSHERAISNVSAQAAPIPGASLSSSVSFETAWPPLTTDHLANASLWVPKPASPPLTCDFATRCGRQLRCREAR